MRSEEEQEREHSQPSLNTTNNANNNNDNTTSTTSTTNYTPREKLLHLMSLLPNTLKDKENLVSTMHKLGDRFSSFLGVQPEKDHTRTKPAESQALSKAEDINEDEFVLVRSNEDITNEIKDEEFAKALQKEEVEGLKRDQAAARQQERERERELQRQEAERKKREEEQQLRQFFGPQQVPDLFTLLLFGLDIPSPQLQRRPQLMGEPSLAPMYILGAAQPGHEIPAHLINPGAEDEPSPELPIVENLPSHVYNGRPLPVEKNSCTICLNEFQQGDTLKTLPCLHMYHSTCIDEWMHVSRTCPICKTPIV